MFIFAVAVQGAATRYRGGETGGAGGGRRRFAGPGPLAPGLQNQRSGAFGPGPAKPKERGPAIWPAPAPLCALCAPAAPPTCRRSPAHPYRKAALTRPCPAAHGPSGPSALRGGGRRGARSAPAGRGPKAPARPVWRPEAAKRRRPPANARFQPPPNRKTDPVQGPVMHQAKGSIDPQAAPGCRQVVMPPSFSCGTDPPPGR